MSHSIQINSTSENQNSRYRIKGCQSWCERVWFIEFGHSGLVSYVYYSCPFLCVYRQSTSQSSSCFAKIHLHKIYGLSILIWIVNPPRLCSTNRSFPYYIVIYLMVEYSPCRLFGIFFCYFLVFKPLDGSRYSGRKEIWLKCKQSLLDGDRCSNVLAFEKFKQSQICVSTIGGPLYVFYFIFPCVCLERRYFFLPEFLFVSREHTRERKTNCENPPNSLSNQSKCRTAAMAESCIYSSFVNNKPSYRTPYLYIDR